MGANISPEQLKIVVTVKQVPDTHNISGDAMKSDGTVNRSALPAIFNPEDLNALEEALAIKETFGAHITVISMGPPKAVEVLKESIYRGADDAILISDGKFAGADTLATSYALKCAIEKIGNIDLVLCGRQAIDGDTAQVGPQLAEKLKINQITSVKEISHVTKEKIVATREVEWGQEKISSKYPALLTITDNANSPRPPSVKRVMAYKNLEPQIPHFEQEIKLWTTKDINADPEQCGLKGSPTKVKQIENVVLTAADAKMVAGTTQGIESLINELHSEHVFG